jgi:hypothetical protein
VKPFYYGTNRIAKEFYVPEPADDGSKLTVLAVTTVVRGSHQGERHGAVYLLDMDGQRGAQVLEWTRPAISWQGHGGARGLRGIGVAGEHVLVLTDAELLVFSPEFELLASHRSPYLGSAQGLAIFEHRVYVISAAFDVVVAFDLQLNRFAWGLQVSNDETGLRATPFDPASLAGPLHRSLLGLQSIHADARGLFLGGTATLGLLHFDGKRIARLVSLPEGARDARPWRDGVLFNDTAADAVRFLTPEHNRVFKVLPYPEGELQHVDPAVARPGFAQGLCVIDEQRFASGASPLTVTVHNIETLQTVQRFNFDLDVRHTVHSMVIWPFADTTSG